MINGINSHYWSHDGRQSIQVRPLEEDFRSIRTRVEHMESRIQEQEKKIEELKDSNWKDKKMAEMRTSLEKAKSELHNGFGVSEQEKENIYRWYHDHRARFHNGQSAGGAIGGGLEYIFMPTSIGVVGTVRCSCCYERFYRQYHTDMLTGMVNDDVENKQAYVRDSEYVFKDLD